jgi:hypothetical protein
MPAARTVRPTPIRGAGAGTTLAVPGHMRAFLAILLVSAVGCVDDPAFDPDGQEDLADLDGKADSATLPLRFLPGEQFVPTASIQTEVRRVFRTEEELEETLGMENPGIDFDTEWAVFYAPGNTNPDLVREAWARIDRVSLSNTGLTIKVTTALEKNGDGCPDRRTRPFLFVAVPIPDDPPPYTRMYRADRTRECTAIYHDGVPFTAVQEAGALRACNEASAEELGAAGIAGTQRSIIVGGRVWSSLRDVSETPNIGATTMARLRDLSAGF